MSYELECLFLFRAGKPLFVFRRGSDSLSSLLLLLSSLALLLHFFRLMKMDGQQPGRSMRLSAPSSFLLLEEAPLAPSQPQRGGSISSSSDDVHISLSLLLNQLAPLPLSFADTHRLWSTPFLRLPFFLHSPSVFSYYIEAAPPGITIGKQICHP